MKVEKEGKLGGRVQKRAGVLWMRKNYLTCAHAKMHARVQYTPTHTQTNALKGSQTCTRQLVFHSCRCSVQLQPCHACQQPESFPLLRVGAIKAYGEHNS